MPQAQPGQTASHASIAGAPCWIDLYSSDTDRATAFYGALFGWTAEAPAEEFGGYFTFSREGKPIGGCMHNDGSNGAPDAWTVYLTTTDIDAVVAGAAAAGGGVQIPPMVVGDHGSMAMLADPGHAAIGAWQPNGLAGFEVDGETGTPRWFELHTRDYDASVAFYRDVFRWDTQVMSDTPEFRYTTLGGGEARLAGIMDAAAFLPEGSPAHWAIYFNVTDVDDALARIVELGGTVTQEADDTPYGRLAQAADPTGTLFKVMSGPS